MCKEAEELLSQTEADVLASDRQRQAAYRTGAEAFKAAGEMGRAQECRWSELAFTFPVRRRSPRGDNKSERFGPYMVLEDGSGAGMIGEVPAEAWEYLYKAQLSTSNSVIKARYADLRWEALQTYQDAESAIDNYQEASQAYLERLLREDEGSVGIALVDAVLRSLELAAHINDQERLVACHRTTLNIVEKMIARGKPRWAYDIVWGLIENKKARELSDMDQVKGLVGKAVEIHRDRAPADDLWERNWLGLLKNCCHLQHDEDGASAAQRAIAASFEATGDAHCRSDGTGTLAAAMWYPQAIEAYKQVPGAREEVERVQRKHDQALKDGESEYRRFSTKVEIPAEDFQKYKAEIEELADEYGLELLGTQLWMPDVSSLRAEAKATLKESPLAAFFTEETIRNGRITSRAASPEEKLEAATRRAVMQDLQLRGSLFIRLAIDRLCNRGSFTMSNVDEVLKTAEAIQPERKEIISRGFERYLVSDYMSAIHLWIFQVEGIIRDMAHHMKCPTTFTDQDGLTQAKNLTKLLADERMGQTLGEDLTTLLQVVLVERPGLNVRHLVAHGLAPLDLFTREVAELLLAITVALANFRAVDVPSEPVD